MQRIALAKFFMALFLFCCLFFCVCVFPSRCASAKRSSPTRWSSRSAASSTSTVSRCPASVGWTACRPSIPPFRCWYASFLSFSSFLFLELGLPDGWLGSWPPRNIFVSGDELRGMFSNAGSRSVGHDPNRNPLVGVVTPTELSQRWTARKFFCQHGFSIGGSRPLRGYFLVGVVTPTEGRCIRNEPWGMFFICQHGFPIGGSRPQRKDFVRVSIVFYSPENSKCRKHVFFSFLIPISSGAIKSEGGSLNVKYYEATKNNPLC